MGKISTTALSKLRAISNKELFAQLENAGWIVRLGQNWELTASGREQGGEVKKSEKFGSYIVWPAQLKIEGGNIAVVPYNQSELLSAKNIAHLVDISSRQINYLLAELGWMSRYRKGWKLTAQGEMLGGVQKESRTTAIPYVLWPAEFIHNEAFQRSLKGLQGDLGQALVLNETPDKDTQLFRQKFPADYHTLDGHCVRSKAEVLIDNWLYMAEIVHAYERKLPIEESVYSEFYIRAGNIHIEYWDHQSDPIYQHIKEKKLASYAKYGFNLIELHEADVENLDRILPYQLLKHGLEVY